MADRTTTPRPDALAGRRFLLVEDEFLIAAAIGQALESYGAHVVGPVPTVDRALALLEAGENLDAAVVDLNLQGRESFPVVDALMEKGVPFVITTGYNRSMLPERYIDAQRFEKPVELEALVSALAEFSSFTLAASGADIAEGRLSAHVRDSS